jgi:hypothetical protein
VNEAAADLVALLELKVRGYSDLLDPENPPQPMSDEDLDRVVRTLIEVIDSGTPSGAIAWALGSTLDPRMIPPLARVVERHAAAHSEHEQHLVYNALIPLNFMDGLDAVDAQALKRLSARDDKLGDLARDLKDLRGLL